MLKSVKNARISVFFSPKYSNKTRVVFAEAANDAQFGFLSKKSEYTAYIRRVKQKYTSVVHISMDFNMKSTWS